MYAPRGERAGSAAAAATVVVALGMLLVLGLRGDFAGRDIAALVAVTLREPQRARLPRPKPAVKAPTSAATGHASPRNLAAQATPIVAHTVQIILPPPPVTTAPIAGTSATKANGASTLPGPDQGAGGVGDGLGGGGSGGNGEGDGEPAVVGPRQVQGKLSMSDLPESLLPPGIEATVTILLRVGSDGRVSECRADRSSGFPELDKLACALIQQRFRFRPARGRSGRPVPSRVIESHSWYAEPAAVVRH